MLAAVCGWHEHHERAAAELNRRLGGSGWQQGKAKSR